VTPWIYLAAGSVAGGLCRYGLFSTVHGRLGFHFPFGNFAVNLSGCLLIGILNALADAKAWVGPHERLLLMTGFCGAYTTFSSLIMETSDLMRRGNLGLAAANVLGSVVLGFAFFRLGEVVGRVL
jgi:CrcB protein